MESRTLVDWLSFLADIDPPVEGLMGHAWHAHIRNELWAKHELLWSAIIEGHENIRQGSGRKPFAISWHTDTGLAWFAGPNSSYVLFEVSGKGCDWLRSLGLETSIISRYAEGMSRIDFAVDIVTDTSPGDFIKLRSNQRIRSVSYVASRKGETVYLGGRKSTRYVRVYRYNAPHPRSRYLRLEFVQRKKHAKVAAHEYVRLVLATNPDRAIRSLAAALGQRFGFAHSDWRPASWGDVNIDTYRPERRSGKTELWLVAQCAPAFKKLVKQGVILDPIAWLTEHFLDQERTWDDN